MKTIDFTLLCNGNEVTVRIDYDGGLELEGYDIEYDQAAQEFGYPISTCSTIIDEWNRGWYFKVIARHYMRFVDSQDVAKAMVAMAEHAGKLVMDNSLGNNIGRLQSVTFWQHGMALQFLKNYAKSGTKLQDTFIDSCHNNVNLAGSQFLNAEDDSGYNYSRALSSAMQWLKTEGPYPGASGLLWHFTEFLADAVRCVEVESVDATSEKLWQLRCFIDIVNP